ncbi:hypothetical protein CAPTEDRAFT_225510 [Capitella teleta]|uniref:CUB domain-containing protein n=1 Tax=Capitella teleta TaxID=283909 RepID=R7T8R0_CAPTE|nr:hypothetical protein CAPTEDRAFT_225510 [Capitella teleta]|eukprot:ELT90059.1 hypothetical protein CAPTEDRAFT_225510 [Capitella teleta]
MEALLLSLITLCVLFHFVSAEPREYCWESFNATCAADEVIVVQSALYGRMKLGRCVNREYYLGCQSDVLPFVERRCSGRRSCTMSMPDTDLHQRQPCPKDLLAYMEADFVCQKVAYAQDGSECGYEASGELHPPSDGSPGYIASAVTKSTGMGTRRCPWRITVPKGQRINITLLDFAAGSALSKPPLSSGFDPGMRGSVSGHLCSMYAVIKETSGIGTDITVCGGEQRERFVYRSEGNQLDVGLESSANSAYFMLRYQAEAEAAVFVKETKQHKVTSAAANRLAFIGGGPIAGINKDLKWDNQCLHLTDGCADVTPPDHGWVNRQRDKVTVGCNHTGYMWHLVCDGLHWVGDFHNCSSGSHSACPPNHVHLNRNRTTLQVLFQKPIFARCRLAKIRLKSRAASVDRDQSDDHKTSLPFGLIIAVIIGIALGVVVGVILLAVVLACQKRVKENKARIPHISGRSTMNCPDPMETDKARILRTGDYGYAHVWELQHLRPGEQTPQDLDLTSGHPNRDTTSTLPPPQSSQAPEFGAHLLKCPKTATYHPNDPHSYESPRFLARDPISGQYLTGTLPVYHAYAHGGGDASLPAIAHDHRCLNASSRRGSEANVVDMDTCDDDARYTN